MRPSGQISRARPKPALKPEKGRPGSLPAGGTRMPGPRVAVYVVRRLGSGMELLVFDHEGIPGAGTHVPAGGIRPIESRREAALREVKDGTGLDAVRVVAELGIIQSPHPESGQSRQTSYWVLEAAEDLPSEWRHVMASAREDGSRVSLCRWSPLPLEVALVDEQGSLLSQLPRLLG